MKLFLIFIFSIVMVTFGILAGDPESDAGVYETTIDETFTDFDDVEFYFDGYIGWYDDQGYFYYVVEIDDGNEWVRADYRIFHYGPTAPQYIYYYDTDEFITDIADDGNGDFRMKGGALADERIVESDWQYFEVDDVTAPSAPANLSVSAPTLNHPKVTWTHNSEIDLKNYKVYRKIDSGSWGYLATTTNNYYWDTAVTIIPFSNSTSGTAYYKATAIDYTDNESAYSDTDDIEIQVGGSPDFKISEIKPDEFSLAQNFPNPFNPRTNITFGIPEDKIVNLVVYNIQGEKVVTLVNQHLSAGSYTANFDGSFLPSGVYIYKIQAGSFTQIKRMLFIK